MNKDIDMVRDESGAVLLLVLIVLIATFIIGMAVMRSTTVETRIAGNDLVYQKDFYACEAAGEMAEARFDAIVSYLVMNETTNTTIDVSSEVNGTGPVKDASVTISYARSSNPPVNSGMSPASCFANYYVIVSEVNGKRIEKGVWKAFPRAE